ncbi:GHKL domain-containing protein [Clostridium botulinum]|nr:GHKL domain-containing protein [Clostridium botulinum]
MLGNFIINSIDTIYVIYFWTILTQKNIRVFKLIFGVLTITILATIIEQLGIKYIGINIITIMLITFLYKGVLKDRILKFLLIILVDAICQVIFSMFTEIFVYDHILKIIFFELIILMSIWIFSKLNLLTIRISHKSAEYNVFIYLILVFSLYVIMFKFIWDHDNKMILDNLFVNVAVIIQLVISQFLIFLYIIKVTKEKEKLKISNEYNGIINEIVEEIKRRQHDFINYKNTIKGMIEVIDEREIKQAIINYIKDEDISDDNVNNLIYIDNVVIKSIIYRSINRASDFNINFKYEIENNILDNILNYHEVSNILNNLINNSFEEVMKSECKEKNIQIKILNRNKIPHLIVNNSIANKINLNKIFERGYSNKSKENSGYGLYNIQKVINSHNGNIKINVENQEITFDICF